MKVNLYTVLFADECRAPLDGRDGWTNVSVATGGETPSRMIRQQGSRWCDVLGSDCSRLMLYTRWSRNEC